MTTTPIYWVEGPWVGKLAIAPRPRGGDWLGEEIQGWRDAGVNGVVSALTDAENAELELSAEPKSCEALGLWFSRFPIADRGVVESRANLFAASKEWDERLRNGENVVIHCRQGVGRSAMLAAFLLNLEGVGLEEAWRRIERARGVRVPDTVEQKDWIERATSAVHLT